MSATRDKTQAVAFVYSNLYSIYQKSKSNPENATPGLQKSQIIKAADAKQTMPVEPSFAGAVNIREFTPTELMAKRIEQAKLKQETEQAAAVRNLASSAPAPANAALNDLKNNLQTLNDLQSRMRFMLKE